MSLPPELVLPADVRLVPVVELADDLRAQLDSAEDDFVLVRPRSRAPSKVVNAQAAELLAGFRAPSSVVDAVIGYSRAHGTDPEEDLESAFPLISQLFEARLLVAADDADRAGVAGVFEPGQPVGSYTVLDRVQALEDTEIYIARSVTDDVALKVSRSPVDTPQPGFDREAAVLRHLDGEVAPRLLADTALDGHRCLVTSWFPGRHVSTVADELRRLPDDRVELGRLCVTVLRAYARLHRRGVVHGDVHPRNVLVDPLGEVCVVDYGLAGFASADTAFGPPPRGGVAYFYEPEYARAARSDAPPPAVTPAGEQYALAALLYLLFTGAQHQQFRLEKQELLRQIAEEPALPFAQHGGPPWPTVEKVLGRALAKNAADRFPSVDAFAGALAAAVSTRPPAARPPAAPRPAPLLDEVLGRTGSLLASGLPAPTGSVNYGAAGIAYALHRIATVRDDPELLATADVWAARAVAAVGDDAAFRSADLDIGPETVGVVSPFHTASGTYAVRALVSHASGEPGERSAAVEAFVRHSRRAETRLDLTLGRSGTLLAGALLLPVARDHAGLRDLGDDTAAGLLEEIRAPAAVADARYLGVAHGWAGVLFALLSWHRARRTPPPTTVVDRLAELAALAEPSGSGLRWPTSGRGAAGGLPRYLSGWCHGTAGYVQLWSVAYAMLADERHLALAEGAGRHTAAAADGAGNLCCGEAGQAYALLHLHRTTGDAHWLTAAKEQARRAVEHRDRARPAHSLYKGEVGVAVLLADLARPSTARMPFFEDEGW